MIEDLMILLERPQTPPQVKRCVAKAAPKFGGDTSKAFAICVSQMQKSGQLAKGSMKLTGKGKKAASTKKTKRDHGEVVAKYEKLLKRNKGS